MRRFSVAIVGLGQFAPEFVELFQAHPAVSEVSVCDIVPERVASVAERNGLTRTFDDFEAVLDSDVDAVAIFTQRWMHGPMAIEALRRGKHVYSAVPMGVSVEEIREIVELTRSTGLTYMMGETSYYYPAVVFCRDQLARGAFGNIIYAEGEYLHDMADGFYEAFKYSGGEGWRATASFPPMLYPTHSVGGVLAVTGSHITSVSCLGVKDTTDDGVFDTAVSAWGNEFSNESALFTTADGGILRVNEFRRVGIAPFRPEVRFSIYGTQGAYEQQTGSSVWQTHDGWEEVTARVTARSAGQTTERSDVDAALAETFTSGFAPVHDTDVLPHSFAGKSNGHEGSHQFLVNDFAVAVSTGSVPPVNAWTAARYTVPGIVAHQSALQDGARLPVPDFGEPPAAG
ncbi:Gfo/Idh/MocA family protein [Leifsonia naganoensis]|uniref:Putative dehydrogenase n=1 Tax=Leifsonia naganoensis TaxID=150025 RepID=A0A853DKD3_9MICO|nr:Gfo/Idh/MocA family oxidoreductase [Leifsonia naganoensis]NYK09556.1 putative dehydrogenase [Leifsonia naganoensis]